MEIIGDHHVKYLSEVRAAGGKSFIGVDVERDLEERNFRQVVQRTLL